jgi:hypothetical protein
MLLKCRVSYPAADGCLGERVGDRRDTVGRGGEERERAEQSSTFTEFKPSDGRLEQREPWMGIADEGLVWKERPEEGHQVSLHRGLSRWADVALLSESATLLDFAFPLPLHNIIQPFHSNSVIFSDNASPNLTHFSSLNYLQAFVRYNSNTLHGIFPASSNMVT